MPDGRLIVPQSGSLKAVSANGEETTLYSDQKHIPDQAVVCGEGRYIVYRQVGGSGGTVGQFVANGFERHESEATHQRPQ